MWSLKRLSLKILEIAKGRCVSATAFSLVPPVGLEPTHLSALDFESSVSANSTTGAKDLNNAVITEDQNRRPVREIHYTVRGENTKSISAMTDVTCVSAV